MIFVCGSLHNNFYEACVQCGQALRLSLKERTESFKKVLQCWKITLLYANIILYIICIVIYVYWQGGKGSDFTPVLSLFCIYYQCTYS